MDALPANSSRAERRENARHPALLARFVEPTPAGYVPMQAARLESFGASPRRCCSVSSAANSTPYMFITEREKACESR